MNNIVSSYAKALSETFNKDQLVKFLEIFQALNQALEQKPIKNFFLSPAYKLALKRQILNSLFQQNLVNTWFNEQNSNKEKIMNTLKNFLFFLLEKRQWKFLSKVLFQLQCLNQEQQNIVQAEVISVKPLSKEVRESLQKKISSFFKKSVILTESISSKPLAGIKIKAGGFVFDDTALYHLQQMELKAKRGVYGYTNQ